MDFYYDGTQARAKKTVTWGGSYTDTYYYGAHYEIRADVRTAHVFGAGGRFASLEFDSNGYVTSRQFLHQDHLGSATVITNLSGYETLRMEYRPFGEIRSQSGPPTVDYMYTDQERDREINLYNYDARMYDPVTARYMSADTIVPGTYAPQTLNRYAYCYNNPMVYVDPTGHDGSSGENPGDIRGYEGDDKEFNYVKGGTGIDDERGENPSPSFFDGSYSGPTLMETFGSWFGDDEEKAEKTSEDKATPSSATKLYAGLASDWFLYASSPPSYWDGMWGRFENPEVQEVRQRLENTAKNCRDIAERSEGTLKSLSASKGDEYSGSATGRIIKGIWLGVSRGLGAVHHLATEGPPAAKYTLWAAGGIELLAIGGASIGAVALYGDVHATLSLLGGTGMANFAMGALNPTPPNMNWPSIGGWTVRGIVDKLSK